MVVKLKVIHHGKKLTDNLKETKYWPKYTQILQFQANSAHTPLLQFFSIVHSP